MLKKNGVIKGDKSPEHWSEFEGNEKCRQSKSQSPIDITTSEVVSGKNQKRYHFPL